MSALRVGLRFDPRHPEGAPEEAARAHAALQAAAVRAEAAGVDVLWVAERPARAGALLPAALPVCAALLARTTRIVVATGLLPLPLHHPLRVAEDAATLDGLSDSRFELGVGLGADPEDLARYGVDPEERTGCFEEAVELLLGAWRPEPVAREGRHFRVPPTYVRPAPRRPGGPPLWVGTRAVGLQRQAARWSAGLLLRPEDSPAPYLAALGARPSAGRLAWLLPGAPGIPSAASLRALVERSGGVACVDLVVRAPDDPADASGLERCLAAVSRIAGAVGPAGR